MDPGGPGFGSATVARVERSPTVVFDLGEVLVPSRAVLPHLAAELGVAVDELAGAYWTGRAAYDLGGAAEDYWTGVLRALGRAPDPTVLRRLADVDAAKWSTLPASSADLLAHMQDRGIRLGVLSNAPGPLAEAVRAAPWSAVIASLVFSADVALVKPDPKIYARADAVYGTEPGDVVFFDDRVENVEAARAHGWDAHIWVGAEAAIEVVARR
jgi:putative hydrolase of the HAD superfamily